MLIVIKRICSYIYYGFLLLKIGGIKTFCVQLTRLIYSRFTQIGYSLEIKSIDVAKVDADIEYTLGLATQEDMNEMLQKAKSESKNMIHKLIFRKMLYDDGFHNCYIARTKDTNEICSLTFTLFTSEIEKAGGRFKNWFPKMAKDEALLEGVYTFQKFRGNKLHVSILAEQIRICQEKGIKNIRVYIEKNNQIPIRVVEKMGCKRFEEVKGLRFLFCTRTVFKLIGDGKKTH